MSAHMIGYNCGTQYSTEVTVLIIFPVILYTIIVLVVQMLFIGSEENCTTEL